MSFGILTNLNSIGAANKVANTSNQISRTMTRLSTGMRINSAADDAAGVAIASRLEMKTRSITQAERNASDSASLLQTAESAYGTVSDVLTRMRELAVQASNGTLTDTDRTNLNTEFSQLQGEIDRISNVTEFNGIGLLDGSQATFSFQVGTENTADNRLKVKVAKIDGAALKVDTGSAKIDSLTDAQGAIGAVDDALDTLNTERATVGAAINQLEWARESLGEQFGNASQALSQVRDADIAAESANFASQQVVMQAGVSMLSQANQLPNLALRLLG